MRIISVIPITRNIGKETLTYYTDQHVEPGAIVTVPLRRKEVPALVVHIDDVKAQRATLRSASFSMKKMKEVHTTLFLLPTFMNALEKAAAYFATTTGPLLHTLVPKQILTEHISNTTPVLPCNTQYETLVLQDDRPERIAYHKSFVREQFAKKQSVLLLLPTRTKAEQCFKEMKRGIEKHAILLHSGLTKKKLTAVWNQALSDRHPILIVATPSFLSIPRNDIAAIIVEEEGSPHYKDKRVPYVDFRMFALLLTQEMNIPLLLADSLLRLETLYKLKTKEAQVIGHAQTKRLRKVQTRIVDMCPYTKTAGRSFRTVSDEVLQMIQGMNKATDRCFIFSLRKGLYPQTVCGDCGYLVRCTECDSPVVVHKRTQYQFVCHKCGATRSAEEKCAMCDSWNLVPLGVGSTRIAEELQELLPDTTIILIDPDTMTQTQIRDTVSEWQKIPASVLIGTETVLQYLKPTTHIAVASLDTLFSLPDFRASERVLRTILLLQSLAEQTLHIQTRSPEQTVFSYALESNIARWQQEELAERKHFGYPPFSTLIKITTRTSKGKLENMIRELEEHLTEYEPQTFAAFTPKVRNQYVVHTLLTLPKGTWPDKKLVRILKSLPPQHIVQVDPEHLM